jgi:alkylation response protein AidB-like acyl-CoA dehydrogenase
MDNVSSDHLILETVERLCSTEFGKYQTEQYYNTVPRPLFGSLASVGLAGLSIPEEFGGLDASAATSAAVFDTISRYDASPAIFVSVHSMVAGLIAKFGDSDQKQRLLPALASGAMLGAFALTEPQAGSDAQALKTEAISINGSFMLKGNKCYITSAGFADLYLVFARTKDSSGAGISAFLVPADTKGVSIGKPERKMGADLSPIASLFFEDALVPANCLLGSINQGFKVALSGLAGGRVNIAACANGLSRHALDIATAHLRERSQFGKQLREFQGLQFMVADMYQKLEAARLLTVKAANDIDAAKRGDNSVNVKLSSSTAKCFATDAAMSITIDAVQLLGGAGYIREYHAERLMRDAKMLQIVEGANQVQRVIISREIMGE